MDITELKKSITFLVSHAKTRLEQGEVDLKGIESGVRKYCEAIAALPLDEARKHEADLKALMQSVTALGESLTQAKQDVRAELQSLERMKNANIAYHKTGYISGPVPKKEDGDE